MQTLHPSYNRAPLVTHNWWHQHLDNARTICAVPDARVYYVARVFEASVGLSVIPQRYVTSTDERYQTNFDQLRI